MPPETREVEVEVLPSSVTSQDEEFARILAWLLDDLFPIPGTDFRIGLDALVGLIPGVGDTSTSAVGSLIIWQAFRRRVPRIVIARMAVNLLINGLVGAVPGVGDLFSAWFKSNRRNYQLLLRHAGARRTSTAGDWIFMSLIIVVILGAVIGSAVLAGWLVFSLLAFLFGR